MSEARRTRFVVILESGAKVEAVEVELLPGWVRAVTPRVELVEVEGERTARREVTGLRRRSLPARRVLEVVELDEEQA